MSDSPVKSTTESQTAETEAPKDASGSTPSVGESEESVEGDSASGPPEASGALDSAARESEKSDEEDEGDDDADSEPAPAGDVAAASKSADDDAGATVLLRHPNDLKTAKVFADIAIDSGPDGDIDPSEDRSRAALLLLSESLFWVGRALDTPSGETVRAEWLESLDQELLRQVTTDPEVLEAAKLALEKDPRGVDRIDPKQLEALSRLTRGLIHRLEAPARAAERAKALRLTKVAALFLLGVVVLVAGVWRLVVPPDLALTATMTTSSSLKQCVNPGDGGSAVFHTRLQKNPWVMYDLGEEHELRLVKVHNRSDCCFERAVPLILETSNDGKNWTEQARRSEVFLTWSAEINAKARYVRLRVPRQVYFHLGPVVIR